MLILLLLLMLESAQGLGEDPLVKVPAGLIQGVKVEDGNYSMFLGVPYAQVQKNNPFGPAIPVAKFEKVFYANDDSIVCPQVDEFYQIVMGSLDCLRVNIYVPSESTPASKLPVLIWIHGGIYNFGSGNRYTFGPKFLIRHGIIFVTMNYRLGPYGFFCLDTPEVPGNRGWKDQRMALRWIKANIQFFGGDENKITILGDSAGSTSVDCHLISEHESLFNQVILQSGCTLCPNNLSPSDPESPLRIAKQLGFQTNNLSEALVYLTNTDAKSVIAAADALSILPQPCVEKNFENVEHILTDYPINLELPNMTNITILAGFNRNESLCAYANKPAEFFDNLTIFDTSMRKKFIYDNEFMKTKDLVRQFYIGNEEISEKFKSQIIDFDSDFNYNFPLQMSIKRYVENGAQNIYQYMFSYSGGRNFYKNFKNVTGGGAAHADQLGYLFDLSYDQTTPSAADQLMIDQITTLWTNFVKYGDPTPTTSELISVKWPPITKGCYTYLDIGSELKIRRTPFQRRLAFWEAFFKLNEKSLIDFRQKREPPK